ncbi:MAG: plasmid pRiA4b ORF-3 family protein [Prevotella sp.]
MAFAFKIKIEGSRKPPIWRKVKVNENLSFDDLHMVIQFLFGWKNEHMYQFSPKGWRSFPCIKYVFEDDEEVEYIPLSSPETFPYGERYDAEKIKLSDYFKALKQKMVYIYDFGDDWFHTIELIEMTDEALLYPICTGGKGSHLVEDSGGIFGFYNLVEAINTPQHPDNKEYREWLGMKRGERWDLNEFYLRDINECLREMWREMKK